MVGLFGLSSGPMRWIGENIYVQMVGLFGLSSGPMRWIGETQVTVSC
jgi:hypothetical protein